MPEHSRQLAAIMFTDIVGYTKLMGEDEEKAFELLKKNRQVQRPLIEQFNGRWLKEIGDGVLASFTTVTDAVYCAKAIQEACLNEDDLRLRIGIHLGEVVFEGEDVFGDGVNIASRLEPLAPIGGILVSESVHKNCLNKKDIETKFIREENLKNVKEPVKIYEVKVEGLDSATSARVLPTRDETKTGSRKGMLIGGAVTIFILLTLVFYQYASKDAPEAIQTLSNSEIDKSIAVLPFVDMSPNKDKEYLGDGIAEELLNVLSKIEGLKVIGRTSSFSYKGKHTDLMTIGEELGVGTILEGSVRMDGNQIRVTAQFINAADGSHIWSESYDRELKDIFKIQDELAQSISESLLSSINISRTRAISEVRIVDDEAYNVYLLGMYHRSKVSEIDTDPKENLYQAINLFNQSLELDDSFANTYVALARTYSHFGFLFGDREIEDAWELAEKYSIKALELDETNSEALRSMAYIRRNKYWDWEGAQEYYRKSVSAAPNNGKALRGYAFLLSAINQHDSAIFYANKALELNPNSDDYRTALMRTAYYARKYGLAINQSEMLEQLAASSYAFRMLILAQTDKDKAAAMILDFAPIDEESKEDLRVIYQNQGWESLTESLYSAYEDRLYTKRFFGRELILIDGAPRDITFKTLAANAGKKVGLMAYILVDPVYDPIRHDPRFDELLKTMGLDKYK